MKKYLSDNPKMAKGLKNHLKKNRKKLKCTVCFFLSNQGIFYHQFSKLITKLINRWFCYSASCFEVSSFGPQFCCNKVQQTQVQMQDVSNFYSETTLHCCHKQWLVCKVL